MNSKINFEWAYPAENKEEEAAREYVIEVIDRNGPDKFFASDVGEAISVLEPIPWERICEHLKFIPQPDGTYRAEPLNEGSDVIIYYALIEKF